MVSSAGTTAYLYDAADRMLSAGPTSCTYDHNGNEVTKTTGATKVGYSYDVLNRMIAATGGGINSQYQFYLRRTLSLLYNIGYLPDSIGRGGAI